MASPSPVPPKRRVVEASSWANSSKIRAVVLGGDADAGVGHLEAHAQPPALLRERHQAEGHLAALGELDGVATEVDQHLAQAHGIHLHARQRAQRRIEQQLDALAGGARRQHLDGVLDELNQVALGGVEPQAVRLELRQVEDVIDDAEQRVGGALDAFGEAPLRGVEARVEQQVGHAEHAVHGRAQLVAHARDEVALGARQHLQLRVALLQLVGALLHGLFQVTAVATRMLAAHVQASPQVTHEQQHRRRVQGARRGRVPRRRRDVQRHLELLAAPGAVGIRGPHPQQVVAGVEVGVGGAMQRTGIDPGRVEAVESIGVVIVGGRGEIQRGELEAHQLVVVGQLQRMRSTGQLARRHRPVEPLGGGQHHARRRGADVDRARREGVEAVVAAEEQRAVAILDSGR